MSDPRKPPYVGQGIVRIDGRLKVTGAARYSSDMPVGRRMLHAVLLESTITRGRIEGFELSRARKVPWVVDILTHQSGLRLHPVKGDEKSGGKSGNEAWMPLQDAEIHWNGQQIGVVLAETLEAATEAASLVKVRYSVKEQNTDLWKAGLAFTEPREFFNNELQFEKGGDLARESGAPGGALLRATYETPVEHHNPIELHATTAVWQGDSLTVYDATQNINGTRSLLARTLGVPQSQVKVISHFLGGGFGCKGFYWPHTSIAAAAARRLHRPVKLVLTRQQMFNMVGHRARTIQDLTLRAGTEGRLTSIEHRTTTQSSRIAEFVEPSGLITKMLYDSPRMRVAHRLARVDTGTPCPTRAPGEATGSFALECAMDELAHQLGIDPVEFRLRNYAEKNPGDDKEYSGKNLRACYLKGRERFGWGKRNPAPRSMIDGNWLVGWGMATAAYPANRVASSAKVTILSDGRALVRSGTQDIGTGTYTIMCQVAADELGLPLERVRSELGNTDFPPGALSGGSQTAASVCPAVLSAARAARLKVIRLAIADPASPLREARVERVAVEGGRLFLLDDPTRGESYSDVLRRGKVNLVEAETHEQEVTRKKPKGEEPPPGTKQLAGHVDPELYAFHSFGAHFVELRVDRDLGEVRLSRMLGVYDVGRILNASTARSQAIGGMTWAAGMALMEETAYDRGTGRIATSNLADYRVPVNADIPPTEAIFLDIPDARIGPIGMRGLGEIPITGMAAAIANAVFHATGKRIRRLPITPDKLLDGSSWAAATSA